MENENKNGANQNKKNKFHKRKGYFIAPPKEGGDKDIKIKETSQQQKSQHNPSHDQQSKNKNKKHRHAGSDAPHQQKQDADLLKANESKKESSNEQRKNKPKNKHRRDKGNGSTHQSQAQTNEKETLKVKEPIEKSFQAQKSARKFNDRLTIKPSTPAADKFDDNEYEQIRFPSANESNDNVTINQDNPSIIAEETPSPMVEVIGIRFKSSGKTYYFAPNENNVKRGDYAIVETARGLEYGEVAMGNKMVKESETVPPLRPVIRAATDADKEHHKQNKIKEEDAFRLCNERIISHGLDMKLIDAQYTFDNSKLLFYFTSSGRVDFRDLVKDLASIFRTRIELRQIGIRDEAKIMGGIGMCGRPLCCSRFLTDFGQVSIKMAKEQNLSLNSAKISGICGRLMCCLRYEHETYEYEIKRTPPVDAFVKTADGNGTVTEISPLRGTVKVRLASSPDAPPKTYKREDVIMLQKKHQKDEGNQPKDSKEDK